MNVTISPGTNSPAGKGCTTIFFSVFAIMGLVFTAFMVKAGFDTARTYFWDRADCVIEASGAREKGDSHEFDVRYTYRVAGRPYAGTRFRMGMSSSLNGEDAQRAAMRYPPGSRVECFVNTSSPSESTLERASMWGLLFIIIPLVFVAVGVGGIIGMWRTGSSAAKAISESHRPVRASVIGLRAFGLFFICIGGGVLYAMLIHPMLKEAAAAKWPRVPCEILSSEVAAHSGSKGGSIYSVEIRYRYDFGGHTYTGTRYDFTSGYSSSTQWRTGAVANFPPGLKTLCRVNPADPVEAVLSVKPSPDRWFGLLPGLFLGVGLLIFFKAPAMAKRGNSRAGIPDDNLPPLPRNPATGEVELKPASTPVAGFAIMLLIALLWNGITWTILWNMDRSEWFGRIFLGVFALIGAALFLGAIHQFLAIFNPRPILSASAGAVPLGGTLDVRWRFTGNARRLTHLAITLEGREEATYRRGTTTTTDKNFFAILPLLDTADRTQMSGGSAKILIPRDLIHTFTAPNNKIVWTLRLAGDIPRWPDVTAEFPITVLPRETATLFQEETRTT